MDLSLGVEHILKLEVAAFHFVVSRPSPENLVTEEKTALHIL